jgi:acetoacetyl-CoA reductase
LVSDPADGRQRELGARGHGKVALVTGGTRGIGEAISEAPHDAGRTVIARYVGNDTAAKSFTEATGITVMKFDACDFESCETAVKSIAVLRGPVEILINNAGITRDGIMSCMTWDMWDGQVGRLGRPT